MELLTKLLVNGKMENIPDIALLKEICSDYNIDINELLNNTIKVRTKIFLISFYNYNHHYCYYHSFSY